MGGPRFPGFDTLALHAGATLEDRMAALEGRVACIATATFEAALELAVTTIAGAGSHVVVARTVRKRSQACFVNTLARLGIETSFVDPRDPQAWRAAIVPATRLLFAETLDQNAQHLLDVAQVAALAHAAHLPLMLDASLTTPYLLRPFEHGADLVCHCAAGFLSGQASLAGGLLIDGGTFDWQAAYDQTGRFAELCEPYDQANGMVFADESTVAPFALRARSVASLSAGAAIEPHDANAILLGVETLSLRMQRHVANSRKIVEFLRPQAAVESVTYPESESHPDHQLANALMPHGCGAVCTINLTGGSAASIRFVDALSLFAAGAAAACPRSSAVHHQAPDNGDVVGAVRLTIGLEDPSDLIDDLARALKLSQKGR